ncbi:hypothetical protein G7Z17_g7348 [Cylindrodendrum hubeiense]|uniref:Heterokaryon incompatibility domain-containing protein n=1 Tax=Cylindrodendrum hubeiense TaxID=595255 RepID=A0A9P5H991_9HYPO|nr:hypothetical protein G7Z17_g7348 [Cylindrodendrum hubeiense]
MVNTTPQSAQGYQPLTAASNEIRILCLEPAEKSESEIRCRIEHVPLAASSNYVALSYCWGGSDKTVPVTVDGQTTFVTPRLAGALAELRRRKYTRIWADAICINQDDDEERSHQVLRMAAIYRSAGAVIAWLGDADPSAIQSVIRLIDGVEALLKFNNHSDKLQCLGSRSAWHRVRDSKTPNDQMRRKRALRRVVLGVQKLLDKNTPKDLYPVNKTKDALAHIRKNLRDSDWRALGKLLSCEYWSRVWIIQELSMANRLQVVWGRHDFSFLDLTHLVMAYKIMRKANVVEDAVPSRACRHIKNLLEFKNLQGGLTSVPLIRALKMTSFAKSSDVRDKVYGLMGLTYDGSVIFPTPSYGSDVRRVNEDATLRIIRLKRSLDHIIFRSKSPGSWVIDWFDSETWLDSRAVSYLSGTMKFHAKYRDYTKWEAAPSSLPTVTVEGQRLVVKGLIVDTIRICSATFEERRSSSKQLPGSESRRSSQKVQKLSQGKIEYGLFMCFCILHNKDLNTAHFLMGIQLALQKMTSGKRDLTESEMNAADILKWVNCPMNSSFMIGGHGLRWWLRHEPQAWYDRAGIGLANGNEIRTNC